MRHPLVSKIIKAYQKKADDKRETPITIRRYPCMLPKFNLFVDLQYS